MLLAGRAHMCRHRVCRGGEGLRARSQFGRLLPASLIPLVSALAFGCSRDVRVEHDLGSAGESGERVEGAVQVPRDAVLDLAGTVTLREDSGEAASLRVWVHTREAPAALLHEEQVSGANGEISALIDLGAVSGQPALIAVSVDGAERVDWTRLKVVGRASASPFGARREEVAVRAPDQAPDIVLYLVDALRPDALSTYGGPIPTPAFDLLAEEGARFETALTTSTWTRPATASLLTGLYPSGHGTFGREHVLPEPVFTLPERLRLAGYRTVAVIANGNVDRLWGFDQGFEVFVRPPFPVRTTPGVPEHPRAAQLHEEALRRWSARDGRPTFLYVHTVDPHGPYNPPEWLLDRPRPAIYERNTEKVLTDLNTGRVEATDELLGALEALYLGEVAYADRELGRFLESLRAAPAARNLLFLLTADHGEGRMEHGYASHGLSLHREELEVPLLLWAPRVVPGGRSVAAAVSLVDVAPTLSKAAGVPARGMAGVDLVDMARGRAFERPLLAELDYIGNQWAALRQGRWTLIRDVRRGRDLLFDNVSDPAQIRNVAVERPDVVARLSARLDNMRKDARELRPADPAIVQGRPDEALRENLRALGYIQ